MHLGNTTSNKIKFAHWSLRRILETSMMGLCFFWNSMNKIITLQHNAIKSWFEKSFHVVSHVFNVTRYKKLVDFVSKYALQYIAEESDWVEYLGLDNSYCGCTIRSTHDLPCACELVSFGVGSMPLQSVHFLCTRLSFLDISSGDTLAELFIQQE